MDFPDGLSTDALRALRHVAARACGPPLAPGPRITLNFHPDRLMGGLPILTSLARDGVYHSQFVTGTSNGGLTAHRGGDRWRWESRIFGGAYDDAEPAARPVYGALDFRRQVVGAAPRFGSSHLRLTARATARATFCYPDSAAEPTDFGVASALGLITLAEADERDALDDYIESHVHGECCSPGTSRPWSWTRATAAPRWRRPPGTSPSRWNGTPATSSPPTASTTTPTTGARNTPPSAPASPPTAS